MLSAAVIEEGVAAIGHDAERFPDVDYLDASGDAVHGIALPDTSHPGFNPNHSDAVQALIDGSGGTTGGDDGDVAAMEDDVFSLHFNEDATKVI